SFGCSLRTTSCSLFPGWSDSLAATLLEEPEGMDKHGPGGLSCNRSRNKSYPLINYITGRKMRQTMFFSSKSGLVMSILAGPGVPCRDSGVTWVRDRRGNKLSFRQMH